MAVDWKQIYENMTTPVLEKAREELQQQIMDLDSVLLERKFEVEKNESR